MGEQDDIAGIDPGIAQDPFEDLDNARGDTVRMVMGRMDGRTACDAAVNIVDQGGFGESPSYVDPDPVGFFAQDFVPCPSGPSATVQITS
jgi:hypothetical protein